MAFQPTQNYVLLETLTDLPEHKTGAGLILPNQIAGANLRFGKVKEVGPGRRFQDGRIYPLEFTPGQTVVYDGRTTQGQDFVYNGVRYVLCRDIDIVGKIEEPSVRGVDPAEVATLSVPIPTIPDDPSMGFDLDKTDLPEREERFHPNT